MPADAQTVLLTGAAGHLGRAVAAHFAAQGANLVLVGRDRKVLEALQPAPPQRLLLAPVPALRQQELQPWVEQARQRFGRIDVLCNLAGGYQPGEPVHATSDAAWDYLQDANVRTLLHAVRTVVPVMLAQGGGCIVNVAAAAGLRAGPRMAAYAASKGAVLRITEAMSAELKERGIRVNCVLPGTLDTPDNRAAMPAADATRWVRTEDLAAVIGFLASDAARAIHGAALPVTGLA